MLRNGVRPSTVLRSTCSPRDCGRPSATIGSMPKRVGFGLRRTPLSGKLTPLTNPKPCVRTPCLQHVLWGPQKIHQHRPSPEQRPKQNPAVNRAKMRPHHHPEEHHKQHPSRHPPVNLAKINQPEKEFPLTFPKRDRPRLSAVWLAQRRRRLAGALQRGGSGRGGAHGEVLELEARGGGKNGKKGGPEGKPVDGPLFWFLCSSQICVPPYSFLKEGFWGACLSFSLR